MQLCNRCGKDLAGEAGRPRSTLEISCLVWQQSKQPWVTVHSSLEHLQHLQSTERRPEDVSVGNPARSPSESLQTFSSRGVPSCKCRQGRKELPRRLTSAQVLQRKSARPLVLSEHPGRLKVPCLQRLCAGNVQDLVRKQRSDPLAPHLLQWRAPLAQQVLLASSVGRKV